MRSKTWPLILLLGLSLGFAGCGGDDDDDDTINPPPSGTTGTISGIVKDLNGSFRSGVSVWIGTGTPAQTNEQGYFVISSVPAGDVVVAFAAADYVPTFRNVTVRANQTTHLPEIALMNAQTEVVDGAAGGTLDAGVGEVTFPANAFVNENGTPYTGEVNVEMASMQPQMDGFFAAFPGEFEGVRDGGEVVPFVSFGIMDITMMNADKSAPVRLAPGVTAGLTMEVADGLKANAPATIPMWYYDEDTSRWIEDGEATLESGTYVTEVDHFTTWNWDMPLEDICYIQGMVEDNTGNPIADARVFSRGLQSGIMDEAYTNAAGQYSVRGIANELFRVWAIKGTNPSEYVDVTLTDCPFVVTTALELLEPAFSIALQWGAEPSDLDSHLIIPQPGAEPYHIYYPEYPVNHRGSLSEAPYALLDTDCQIGYGPEVISGFRLYEGRYEYFVVNYSGNSSHPLIESGAVVNLAIGNQSRAYTIANAAAPDGVGVCHVFDLVVDGAGGATIVGVMTFEDPYNLADLKTAQKR